MVSAFYTRLGRVLLSYLSPYEGPCSVLCVPLILLHKSALDLARILKSLEGHELVFAFILFPQFGVLTLHIPLRVVIQREVGKSHR